MTRPDLPTADAVRRIGRRLDRLTLLAAGIALMSILGFMGLGLLIVGLAVG